MSFDGGKLVLEQQQRQQQKQQVGSTGADLAIVGAAASVLMSWYVFYVQRNRELGLFVGLWPPTILAFASYLKHIETNNMLERSAMTSARQTVRETVEGLMG